MEKSIVSRGAKLNWLRSSATQSAIWAGVRKFGVPPPKCSCTTGRPLSNSGAIRAISRYR